MRLTRRLVAGVATAVCVAGAVAGCAATVDGKGALGSVAAPASGAGSAGSPATSGSPTGFPSSSAPSSGNTTQGALSSYLISAPSGSEHGSSVWANTTSPSVTAFVQHFYDPDEVTGEVARLQADGITGVAHNLWIHDDIQFDVVLLQFSSATGAETRHSGVVAATQADSTQHSTRPAISGDVTEFYASTVDKLGNISSRAYGIKGDIALEVFCFSPKTFDQKDLTDYTAQQIAKLP